MINILSYRHNIMEHENIYEVVITTYTKEDWYYILDKVQELEMNDYFDEVSENGMTVFSNAFSKADVL